MALQNAMSETDLQYTGCAENLVKFDEEKLEKSPLIQMEHPVYYWSIKCRIEYSTSLL